MTPTPTERVLDLLHARDAHVRRQGHGYTARCPAHDDRVNSLSLREGAAGQVLLHCFAGCEVEQIAAALGLMMRDLFADAGRGGRGPTPSFNGATAQRPPGCTLAQYADAKRIPVVSLRTWGLSDVSYQGTSALRIPYRDRAGMEVAVRFRLRLEKSDAGNDRFRWKSGAKPCLYGRDRLGHARERGFIALVEGESDCHTLWLHNEPAVGVPGADLWRQERDAPELDGIDTIYLVVEQDQGGETLRAKLAKSTVRDRVRLVDLGKFKDPSGLYLDDPDAFLKRWRAALHAAVPLLAQEQEAEATRTAEAWALCESLAREPDILARVAETLAARGVAGEAKTLKLLYLILVSRFLPRPVSAAVKGPSSGGKSFTVERVLDLFPADAYHALSAMSERALAYGDEPLTHRFLVLYEAAGMTGDMASYLIRSLLSEGKVRYETVEKTTEGLRPRLIERAGPTGLLVTTTAASLHPENETRLLSIRVTDTPEQTRSVLRALAEGIMVDADNTTWHALQKWLATAEHRVAIPYARHLSDLVPPVAVRLRRDFGTLLGLVRTHAILHQANRDRDDQGRVLATVADYAAVRDLVADLIAEGVEATVSATIRETVAAVEALIAKGMKATLTGHVGSELPVSVTAVAKALGIDKGSASRRVKVALEREYLKNLETGRGKPYKLAVGEPLPADVPLLPMPDQLAECCTVAEEAEEVSHSPSPSGPNDDSAAVRNGWTCLACGSDLPADRAYYCPSCEVGADAAGETASQEPVDPRARAGEETGEHCFLSSASIGPAGHPP